MTSDDLLKRALCIITCDSVTLLARIELQKLRNDTYVARQEQAIAKLRAH